MQLDSFKKKLNEADAASEGLRMKGKLLEEQNNKLQAEVNMLQRLG